MGEQTGSEMPQPIEKVFVNGTAFPSDVVGIVNGQMTAEKAYVISTSVAAHPELFSPLPDEATREKALDQTRFHIPTPLAELKLGKQSSVDNAIYFRGMTLADLVIAAIAVEGKIISRYGNDCWTEVTQYDGYAVDYAKKHAYKDDQQEELRIEHIGTILQALQMPLTQENMDLIYHSVLYAPIVLRFDRKKIEADPNIKIGSNQYRGMYDYLPITPYLTIEHLTDACLDDIRDLYGIDILSLVQKTIIN